MSALGELYVSLAGIPVPARRLQYNAIVVVLDPTFDCMLMQNTLLPANDVDGDKHRAGHHRAAHASDRSLRVWHQQLSLECEHFLYESHIVPFHFGDSA